MVEGVLFLHFSNYKFQYWKPYFLVITGIVICFIIKQTLTAHSYEIAKMEQFMLNLTERRYGWNNYIKPLLSFYRLYYKEVWIIALITFGLYVRKRYYFTGVEYLVFLILTQYIIALTYPGIRHSRYQEQCYYPLIFVACFPLIMHLSQDFVKKMEMVFYDWNV